MGTLLLTAVALSGCQPGRHQSPKPDSFFGPGIGSTEQQIQFEAWRLLLEDGLPTQKLPQVRSIFDHLVGVAAPFQSNLFTAGDVADVAELSELQATYQRLWCEISPFVQVNKMDGKVTIREGLAEAAEPLRLQLWQTYNNIQGFAIRPELKQKLIVFVSLSRSAESAVSRPKAIPLFDTSAASVVEDPDLRVRAAQEIRSMVTKSTTAQIGSTQRYPQEPVKPKPKPEPEPEPEPMPMPMPKPGLPPGAPDSCSHSILFLPPPILGVAVVFRIARKIKERIHEARQNLAKGEKVSPERPSK